MRGALDQDVRRVSMLSGGASCSTTTFTCTSARVRGATRGLTRPRVFWRIWDAPLITIGRGSFLSQLVDIAGARKALEGKTEMDALIAYLQGLGTAIKRGN